MLDFLQQGARIDRLDRLECDRLLRFVRLEMSDEMPAKWKIRGLGDLRQPFLDFVFAEINLSSVCGGANVVGGKRLRDGDEPD
jgi:hypothetical protein